MQFITTNSSAQVEIQPATFKDATKLKQEAYKCLNIDEILKGKDLTQLMSMDFSLLLPKLIEALINIETSEGFEKALFGCLGACFVESKEGIKRKITPELFDEDLLLREDYYEIAYKCCEANLRPFFKSLVSGFQARLKTPNKSDQE